MNDDGVRKYSDLRGVGKRWRLTLKMISIFADLFCTNSGLYYIIENSYLRIIATQMQQEDNKLLEQIRKMRPRPSNFVVWGSTQSIIDLYKNVSHFSFTSLEIAISYSQLAS